jgi:predicted MFS family arabinose efflux permease
MAVFFVQGASFANWLPRIPDVQQRMGVGPADLSIGLLGMGIAGLIALLLMGTVVERLTPRGTILLGLVALGMSLMLPGWAWNVPSLFAALFLVGIAFPMVDVAMNVEANRIESAGGRRIMSTCHGFWSTGTALGALVGSGFAGLGMAPGWHLIIIGGLTVVFGMLVPPRLPVLARVVTSADRRLRHVLTMPTVPVLAICCFAFGMLLVEGTARNWSAVFLRDVSGGSPASAGLAYAAFATCMAIARFAGDRLADRWGPVTLARICCLVAIVGIAAVVASLNQVMAIAGFALAGLGVSVAFPLAVTAAASLGDRPAPMNVAAFSLINAAINFLTPVLVGFVAQFGGLRLGIATLLPPLALSLLMAVVLARRPTPALAARAVP